MVNVKISRLIKAVSVFLFVLVLANDAVGQNKIGQLEQKIDSLLSDAIDSMAFPGAQVLVIHSGKQVLHKSYGYHTYNQQIKVDTTHLYDLASVTKVMAGGLALMKMQDEMLFHPSMKMSETHPFLLKSNKADITWRQILAHQSRMQSYIVFWQKMQKKNGKYRWRTFTEVQKRNYTNRINDELFLHKRYPKLMRREIKKSSLHAEEKYLYSGLAFLLIPEMVLEKTSTPLDEYLNQNYFKPMNLKYIGFRPSERFPIDKIVPTEIDTVFRHRQVQGYVHDENAAMLDGVSANAGLFSTASDLGEISKMLLNEGVYHDRQILDSAIIDMYNTVQYPENDNRRGLTFDKPLLEYKQGAGYIAESASPSSFGHSGFTGTFIWLDPEYELIVIFLSNRVYPHRSQTALYKLNFRPKLHQFAYDYVQSIVEEKEE